MTNAENSDLSRRLKRSGVRESCRMQGTQPSDRPSHRVVEVGGPYASIHTYYVHTYIHMYIHPTRMLSIHMGKYVRTPLVRVLWQDVNIQCMTAL